MRSKLSALIIKAQIFLAWGKRLDSLPLIKRLQYISTPDAVLLDRKAQ